MKNIILTLGLIVSTFIHAHKEYNLERRLLNKMDSLGLNGNMSLIYNGFSVSSHSFSIVKGNVVITNFMLNEDVENYYFDGYLFELDGLSSKNKVYLDVIPVENYYQIRISEGDTVQINENTSLVFESSDHEHYIGDPDDPDDMGGSYGVYFMIWIENNNPIEINLYPGINDPKDLNTTVIYLDDSVEPFSIRIRQ